MSDKVVMTGCDTTPLSPMAQKVAVYPEPSALEKIDCPVDSTSVPSAENGSSSYVNSTNTQRPTADHISVLSMTVNTPPKDGPPSRSWNDISMTNTRTPQRLIRASTMDAPTSPSAIRTVNSTWRRFIAGHTNGASPIGRESSMFHHYLLSHRWTRRLRLLPLTVPRLVRSRLSLINVIGFSMMMNLDSCRRHAWTAAAMSTRSRRVWKNRRDRTPMLLSHGLRPKRGSSDERRTFKTSP